MLELLQRFRPYGADLSTSRAYVNGSGAGGRADHVLTPSASATFSRFVSPPARPVFWFAPLLARWFSESREHGSKTISANVEPMSISTELFDSLNC